MTNTAQEKELIKKLQEELGIHPAGYTIDGWRPKLPVSAEWVQQNWNLAQSLYEHERNEYEIRLVEIVLNAIATNSCNDPAACAEIVQGFHCYPA